MATLEIHIPIEVVEAGIASVYGLEYPVEVLDVILEESSGDLVILIYVDDADVSEVACADEIKEHDFSDTWTVTTTRDFIEGVL